VSICAVCAGEQPRATTCTRCGEASWLPSAEPKPKPKPKPTIQPTASRPVVEAPKTRISRRKLGQE